jgi:hypothetical protein
MALALPRVALGEAGPWTTAVAAEGLAGCLAGGAAAAPAPPWSGRAVGDESSTCTS